MKKAKQLELALWAEVEERDWSGPEFKVMLLPGQRQCGRCGIPHSDTQFSHCEDCRREFKTKSLPREPRLQAEPAYGFAMMRETGMRRFLPRLNNRSTMEILDRWDFATQETQERRGIGGRWWMATERTR